MAKGLFLTKKPSPGQVSSPLSKRTFLEKAEIDTKHRKFQFEALKVGKVTRISEQW